MKFSFLIIAAFIGCISVAQPVNTALRTAVNRFENDSQMKHAAYSLYVADAVTGKPVFEKNIQTGLATASCLKLVTSAMSFEQLGRDFHYQTNISYIGKIQRNVLDGDVYITGCGDPTLGSWRWETTKTEKVLNRIIEVFKENKVEQITGAVFIDDMTGVFHNVVPGAWNWDDLGNYYGAPARLFNWHENQYDVFFKTGAVRGEKAVMVKTEPLLPGVSLYNYVTAGPKGSGDKTVIYLPPHGSSGYITGTVPVAETSFTVSGAMPNPAAIFIDALNEKIKQSGIVFTDTIHSMLQYYNRRGFVPGRNKYTGMAKEYLLGTVSSPSLDSMNYWFMRRSINLYGEAFLRTVTDSSGTRLMNYAEATDAAKSFWKKRGIDESALNIYDGSGLSPQNRVTTHALVKVLQFARTRPWFSAYYNAFPEYNGMKLKSGTIADVKGFAGYHKARNGKEYIIAFLVNNYDGTSSSIVGKMYKVLDELK